MTSGVHIGQPQTLIGQDRRGRGVAGQWTVGRYFFALGVLALIVVPLLALGHAIGELEVLAVCAAIPAALVVLWKPELGLYMLVLYGPFESFGRIVPAATLTKVLGLYTFGALLVHLVARQQIQVKVPAFWFALGGVAWGLITVLGAESAELAWWILLTHIQLVGLMFVVLQACANREQTRTLLWALFVGSVLAAGAAFFLSPDEGTSIFRSSIGEINTNTHAKNLMAGVLLVPFLWHFARGRVWLKVMIGLGLVLVLVGIGRTGSRAVYLSVFLGLVVAIMTYQPLSLTRRILLTTTAVVGLVFFAVVGAALGVWQVGLWDRIMQVWNEGFRSGSRLWFWQHGLKMGAEHPLLGVGVGNFRLEFLRYGLARSVHNDLIERFAETGVPGLLLYLGFLGVALRRAWRVRVPALRSSLVGLFVAAVLAAMANPSFGLKSFWLHISVCVLGGLLFGSGAQQEASTPQDRLAERAQPGPR